jgi:hypothetical protein
MTVWGGFQIKAGRKTATVITAKKTIKPPMTAVFNVIFMVAPP